MEQRSVSHAVASAWPWMLLPFALVGLWTPLARASSVYEGTAIAALVFAGLGVGAVSLAGAWHSLRTGLLLAALGSAIVGAATSSGLGIALAALCLLACSVAAIWATRRIAAALPDLSSFASRSGWVLAWGLGVALLGVAQAARTAAFLADPSFTAGAVVPDDPFLSHHACLTAYIHGSILADAGVNIYDLALGADGEPTTPLPPTAAHFAPFALDAYGYPPPFLLLPKLLRLLSEDFVTQRALFALLGVAVAFVAAGALAVQLGGEHARGIWLLAPIGLLIPAGIVSVSISNFHLMMVGMCTLAWVAFERRKHALGGGLLAFAVLSKISPGLLGVLLLVQRRFAVAFSVALMGVVIVVASWPATGLRPWVDFLGYHLPHLSDGSAFEFLDRPGNVIFNVAPFGIPFKLAGLGFEGWGWAQAKSFNSVFTLVLVGITVVAGLRGGPPAHRAIVWSCLLFLASLRSPYAPGYVACSLVFVQLVLAGEVRTRRQLVLYLIGWVLLCLPEQPGAFGFSLVRQLLLTGCVVWLVVRRPR